MGQSPWVPDRELCDDLDCTQRTLRRIKAKRLVPLVEVAGRDRVSRQVWERLKAGKPAFPAEAAAADALLAGDAS